MGIKLMVEIMDHWQDAGLTPGERADLLVLAENARDSTRETFGPVHEDYILKRVGKKAATWRVAIAALKTKGVLEYAVRDGRELSGRPGQHAVYRFPILCPEAPHDGLRGQCTRSERVSSHLTHPEPDAEAMGYPSANALDGMGYATATECVSQELTPTPPSSSEKTSSSLSSDVTEPAAPAPPAPSERETDAAPIQKPTAAQRAVRSSGAIGLEEEQAFIAWATVKFDIKTAGWWKVCAGDIPEHADVWRAGLVSRSRPVSDLPEWCGSCGAGSEHAARTNVRFRVVEILGERHPCPDCHPSMASSAA